MTSSRASSSDRVARERLTLTAEGTSSAPFGAPDWGLVAAASMIWGASFLFIAEGLETLAPGVVTLLRIAFGWLALTTIPRARATRVDREDWPRLVILAVVWLAIPMTIFPIAEQWISSSITGMLNGALPIFSTGLAALLLRRLPGRYQIAGITVGFAGIVLISLPSWQGGSRTALGAVLVLVAMMSYAVASNLMVPLQHRYGALAVIWRAQLVGMAMTAPYGIVGLTDSTFAWKPVGAVFLLGTLGTGLAFVLAGTLFGRVGASRGSINAYLIPVVALALGVVLRDDHVEAIAVAGLGLAIVGAWLTSRAGH
ncbi:MAG: DMT family transporter [Actinomycetota bacterium]|nr:DMT family transporter [Actinomycetota bacterium]